MRREKTFKLPAVAGLSLVAMMSIGLAVLPSGQALASAPQHPAVPQRACNDNRPGHANCLALGFNATSLGSDGLAPSGYGPADIASAYNLPSGGRGVTVAIVDAYDDPNAEKDLATYRSNYGLPACTTANGCFTKTDQRGGTSYPTGDTGWGAEIALDLDAVSAACPQCNILLVEADDSNNANLYAADDTAAQRAKFVSNSWSSTESSTQSSDDKHFNVPGVLFAFATGDGGYSAGTQYPASSPYTLAVGGTSLSRTSGGRGWSETAWSGAGSGCSAFEAQPAWQKSVGTGCAKKANSDVSAVADPQTGLAIYDTYGQSGWLKYGGTSLSTPLITAMYALAGAPGANDNPASYPYAHAGALYDVTSGSNGSCGTQLCSARSGWDGPTGLGTPNGVSAFTAGGTPPPSGVTVANPGDQNGAVGTAVSLRNSASGGTAPYTWSASGLPTGLAVDSAAGTVSGTPTTAGTFKVTLTAKDSTGAAGSTTFNWTVSSSGQGGTVTVTDPGGQTGFTGFQIFGLQITATDSKSLPLAFTAAGLPPGLTISSAGYITGTPTTTGTYSVTVKATDTAGTSGSSTFIWTIYQVG